MKSVFRIAPRFLPLVFGCVLLVFTSGCVFDGEADVDIAWSALKKGDLNQSIRFTSRAINFGGLSGEKLGSAYECRAAANRDRNEFDRALADLDRLVTLRPDYAGGYLARGEVLFRARAYDRALTDMDKGLGIADPVGNAKGPTIARRYVIRGNIRLVKKEADQAMADYEHALAIDPSSLDARMGRSFVFEARGRKREALVEMELVCQAASKNFSLPLSRQSVYLHRVVTLRMANGLDPSKPADVLPAEAPPVPAAPKTGPSEPRHPSADGPLPASCESGPSEPRHPGADGPLPASCESEPAESPEAQATPDTDIQTDGVSEKNLDKPLLGN